MSLVLFEKVCENQLKNLAMISPDRVSTVQ